MTPNVDDPLLELAHGEEEPTPRQLMIFILKMSRAQEATASLLAEIAKDFQQHQQDFQAHREQFNLHVDEERALVNKAIGGWKALAAIGSVVIVMSGYILNNHLNALLREAGRNDSQEARLQRVETDAPISREADKRLTILENTMKDLLGMQIDNRQRLTDIERQRAIEQRAKK